MKKLLIADATRFRGTRSPSLMAVTGRVLILSLALLLTFSLAACGGGNEPPTTSGGDTPLTRSDGSSSQATTPSGSDPAASAPDFDMNSIMGGGGTDVLISGFDPATKQAFIDEAKADGYDVTFNPDGSMKMEHKETGEVMIQNSDGSWNIEDSDGSSVQVGGDWPDNEFTKLLPVPEFSVTGASLSADSFSVAFVGVTIEQVKAYAEEVKQKGFTVDAETEEQAVMGMTIFVYSAKNADGYSIEVSFASGAGGLSIEKP